MEYILYIDESYDSKSKYIIMAGFVIPIKNWKEINDEIKKIKLNYFSNSAVNLKKIRRKKYDEYKFWEKLTSGEKESFNTDFYEVICKPDNLIIIALLDKEKMDKKDNKLFFHLAYGFIIERYQYFLSEKGECGLVIMDSAKTSKEIRYLYNSHKEFLEKGIPVKLKKQKSNKKGLTNKLKIYEKLEIKNLCENLIFIDDEDSNMLQIVDMIAAAINGKYNRNIDKWFEKIKPIIRKSSEGKVEGYGIKFFPL